MIKTIIFDFDDTLYTVKDNWKDIDKYWKEIIRTLVGKKEEEKFFQRHKLKSPIHSNDVISCVRSEGYDINKFAEIVENKIYDRGDMEAKTMPNEFFEELKMRFSLYVVSMGRRKYLDFYIKKYGIEKVYDDFQDIFTDPDVDIIYLTTPHNTHYPFMKKALENHKHLFVEKSITLNSRELNECVKLAQENNLILAEAMTIWHMPIYKQLWEMIHNNEFGKVQMITVNFGSFKDYDMTNRFFNKNLAGGALLDIGVYALSLTRSFMQSKPTKILSQMLPAPTGVDEQATILLMNEDNQMATIALSLHSKQPKRAMISCEKAYIEIRRV